jgi:hypothetical protein
MKRQINRTEFGVVAATQCIIERNYRRFGGIRNFPLKIINDSGDGAQKGLHYVESLPYTRVV